MSSFLAALHDPTDVYDLVIMPDGIEMTRRPGHEAAFNEIARQAINHVDDFAVFPTSDGAGGYERLFILPTSA